MFAGGLACGAYDTWAALCELFGAMDPDSKFGSEGSRIITGEYVERLKVKEREVRKLVLANLPPTDHGYVFHAVEHIIATMAEVGSVRNIWTMPGERAMGGQVRQIHSKSNPTANLAAVVSQNANSRAQAGFVQLGCDFLERMESVPNLSNTVKKIKNI